MLAGPGTDSGTFDYFTDVINGEEGASRADYTASEDDNVTVQARRGRQGRPRLLRLHVLRGEPGHAEGGRGRQRRRLRRPERRDGAGRHLHAALAAAVHLPVEGRALTDKPQVRLRRRTTSTTSTHITELALFIPPTAEQIASRPVHARVGNRQDYDKPPVATPDNRRRRAAGSPAATRRAALGRGRRQGLLRRSAPSISIATTVGIVFALRSAGDRVLPRGPVHGTSSRARGGLRSSSPRASASFRCSPAPSRSRSGPALVCDPVRARRRDLHERVRPPDGAQDAEARARVARGHPDGRLRVLRAPARDAAPEGPRLRHHRHVQRPQRRASSSA